MKDPHTENIEKLRDLERQAKDDLAACESAAEKQRNRLIGIQLAIAAISEPVTVLPSVRGTDNG